MLLPQNLASKPWAALPALRWMLVLAAAMVLAPWMFSSPFAQAVLTQIGIAIVACLSYNILLGQGGMLSFGHAVYTGLGAYMAMHVLLGANSGGWAVPISRAGVCHVADVFRFFWR